MTIRDEEIIRDRLNYYWQLGQSIHITLISGRFRNGKVTKFNDDSIIFIDEKLGEVIIYLDEISYVEKRLEKNP